MNDLRPLLTVLIVALVLAGGASLRPDLWKTTPPPVLAKVPAFQLVGDQGQDFASTEMLGRPWLASFLFTSCPGPCPRLVQRLKVWRQTIPADELAMVSFSVDPANDTPEVLADYKRERGLADEGDWTLVTGPPEIVLDLVRNGFLTAAQPSEAPEDEGAVIHGVRVALVDGQGQIRGFYATEGDEGLTRLQNDLAALR